MELKEFFAAHPKIALAFSGGVDSAYLLYAAKQLGAEVRAYYVKTAFQPQFELDDAKRLVEALHADMTVLLVDILSDTRVAANPANRCYFCKKSIFSSILHAASADGFTTLIDGTNASDDAGDRPGMQALRELKVYSPLRDCGLTKADVRRLSKEAGLFTWNKPAYACLATRIPAETRSPRRIWRGLRRRRTTCPLWVLPIFASGRWETPQSSSFRMHSWHISWRHGNKSSPR